MEIKNNGPAYEKAEIDSVPQVTINLQSSVPTETAVSRKHVSLHSSQ